MTLLAARRDAFGYGYDVWSGPYAAVRRHATGIPPHQTWLPPRAKSGDLVRDNLDWARMLAGVVIKRYNLHSIDRDDLHQAAVMGLMSAAKRWNPDVNDGDFRGYASYRVMGSVLDEVRKWDFAGRHARRDGENAKRLVSLDVRLASDDGESELTPSWLGSPEQDLDGWMDMIDKLSQLTPRQQYILLRLAAGYTMREVGEALGVTESRVSQLVTAAQNKLGISHGERERRRGEAPRKRPTGAVDRILASPYRLAS